MSSSNDKKLTTKEVFYNPLKDGRILSAVATTGHQREILATVQLEPEASVAFNEVLDLKLIGHLNQDALTEALSRLQERHAILRSVFSADGAYLLVKEKMVLPLKRITGDAQTLQTQRQLEVSVPFDLLHGPCFRAVLVSFNETEHHLIMSFHHAICDGWSLAILLNEFSEIYSSLVLKQNLVLEEVDSFIEYAESVAIDPPEISAFWIDQFKQLPRSLDWSDKPRPAYRTYRSQRFDKIFNSEWVKGLKQYAAQQGASLYTVLMAGFSWELAQAAKASDLVIGMASAAQANLGRPGLVGHLVSLLPLRLKLTENLVFKSHVAVVKQSMLQAFTHPELTFGEFIQTINAPRDPSRVPLISAVFNIDQQNPDQGMNFTGLKASYETVPRVAENFEIFVNVVSRGDHLSVECQYNTDLFSEHTIQQLFNKFEQTLATPQSLAPLTNLVSSTKSEIVTAVKSAASTANTELSQKVVLVWNKILGKKLQVDDNFFSQGGHSLLAVEAARALAEQLGHKIAAKHVFSHPTATQLAGLIPNLPRVTITKTRRFELELTGPLSPAQWQAWYLEQIAPGTTMHNLPAAIRLRMPLDVSKLSEAFRQLMLRQPTMRMQLTGTNQPTQQVQDIAIAKAWPDLTVVDCAEADVVATLDRWAQEVIETTRAPLFRARLLRISSDNYVLFFMVHHLIWDGWSFDVFFAELDELYQAQLTGRSIVLSPVQLGPVEIAKAALQYRDTAAGMTERAYWQQKLVLPLPKIEWQGSKPRPRLMSHVGHTLPFLLAGEQVEAIKRYAQEHATTPFVVFLTAFARLVARHSQLQDVIIGMPVRNREAAETQNVIGYFVNSVALRLNMRQELNFEQAIKVTETVLRDALEHQTLPFTHVLEDLKLPRDPSRTPVFQAFFSFQDVSNREAKLANVSYTQINIDKASTHTDLDVWVKLGKTKLEGAFEFRRDLFSHELINGWCREFLADIEQVVIPKTASHNYIVDAVERMAQTRGNQPAIKVGGSETTYAELWKKVEATACSLQALGAVPGECIGVSMTRGSDMLITLLAIIRTGAAYVPLDPMFPAERLELMLTAAKPKAVITGDITALKYGTCIPFSSLKASSAWRPVHIAPNSPMYVIFTSGSTGTPKGVEVSFSGVENFLRSMSKKPGMTHDDHLLAVTTLSFDIAVLELYLPFTVGGRVVIASSTQVMDGDELAELISSENITIMQATPITWRLLYGQGWMGKKDLKILCGGEAFPYDLAQKLIADCGSVWNMYGPTETTVWSTCRRLVASEKITIGGPIAETQLLAMDESGHPVSRGEVGELWIGGSGVANGYFQRPDLTSERFVMYQGARFYRTGDLARQLTDNDWECLGRIDTQVKIRGYRIELGEIEVKLRAIAGIADAVVDVQDWGGEDRRLVAFIKGKFTEAEVKETLSQTLPNYMVPAHYATIADIPLTPNGKVDRKSLPLLAKAETNAATTSFKDLRALWQHYLNVQTVNDHDDFFDLGGNSLLAVEIVAAIQRSFGVEVGLAHLIQSSTFGEFNRLLEQRQVSRSYTSLVPIAVTDGLKPLFLFHGVGGNVMNYVVFANALKNKCSLYGIQSVGLDGKHAFLTTVESMAESYLAEIRRVQPTGPYLLGGGSMGGTIAFEVALLLQRMGEKVERIVMFDTFGPDVTYSEDDPIETAWWPRIRAFFVDRTRRLKMRLKKKLAQRLKLPTPIDVILAELETSNYRALSHYRPGVFDGDITLIRAQLKDRGWYSDPHMGWHKVVKGKIETFHLDGAHHNFIENPKLAELLKKLL